MTALGSEKLFSPTQLKHSEAASKRPEPGANRTRASCKPRYFRYLPCFGRHPSRVAVAHAFSVASLQTQTSTQRGLQSLRLLHAHSGPRSSRQQIRRARLKLASRIGNTPRLLSANKESCLQISSIARPLIQRCTDTMQATHCSRTICLAVPSATCWRQVVTKHTCARGQVSSLPPVRNSENADM